MRQRDIIKTRAAVFDEVLSQDKETINLPNNTFGNVHLSDILPQMAKEWQQGSMYCRYKPQVSGYLSSTKANEIIGILEIEYTKHKTIEAITIANNSYPIVASREGILLQNYGTGEVIYEKGATDDFNGKPLFNKDSVVFSFYPTITDAVLSENNFSTEEDSITKEQKLGKQKQIRLHNEIRYTYEASFSSCCLIIHFMNYEKEINLKQLKKYTFLFDTDDIISFNIDKKLTTYNKKESTDFRIKLNEEQVNLFSQKNIQLVRITLTTEDTIDFPIGKIYAEYFKVYTQSLIDVFHKNNWKIQSANQSSQNSNTTTDKKESCYVYLMHDEINGYYKIGISNKPEYREHTLQSEKPSIVLIQAKKFPIRQIAEAYESALHKTYEDKRLRGEWFKLEPADVENLIIALQ